MNFSAVRAGEEDGIVAVGVGEAAECVVAGGVIAAAAGWSSGGVFLGGASGAAVDVEPHVRVACVHEFLRDVKGVEGVGVGCVVELKENGGDLVVGGSLAGDEGCGGTVGRDGYCIAAGLLAVVIALVLCTGLEEQPKRLAAARATVVRRIKLRNVWRMVDSVCQEDVSNV
jgi:hypothetical protein